MRRGRKFVSPYNPASSSKQSKRAQSAEDLYGDILTIKRKNVRLKQENKELKTSIQRLTHQVKKKDRSIYRVLSLTPEQPETTPRLLQEIKSDMVSIGSLNERIGSLEEQIRKAEEDLHEVTTNTKYTRIREVQIQSQVYIEEANRITKLIDQLIGPREPLNTSRSAKPVSARRPRKSYRTRTGAQTSRKHHDLRRKFR
eukprot:jgi/Bigna1/89711/estExt_fgenesh1_pg.C_540054